MHGSALIKAGPRSIRQREKGNECMKKLCSALLALALSLSLCLPAFAAESFTDVEGWAAPYIERAASLGLVSGVGGGRFAPDSQVS